MRTVFFGDSITAGENNNDTSFVDYYPGTTYNLGISGTTIGEYSIYPVDGNSLLSVISRSVDIIKKADTIFIEYGANDVSAIMCGFATEKTVIVSFVKAIDWIKQINPNCKIIFLSISKNYDIINMFASATCNYLSNDYFKGYNFTFPGTVWAQTYISLLDKISLSCEVKYMFDDNTVWDKYISDDNIHPSDYGHTNIAGNIM